MSVAPGRILSGAARNSAPFTLAVTLASALLLGAVPGHASPPRHLEKESGASNGAYNGTYNGEEDGPLPAAAVARSRLGLSVQTVNAEIADALGLHADKGALVTAVLPGGPGEEAGLKRGDVILRVDDAVVRGADGLAAAFSAIKPGREIDLTLMRGIKTLELSITPRSMPPAARVGGDEEDREMPRNERLGLKVADPDRWLRRRYGIGPGQGAVVLSVAEGSRAQVAGVQEGDLIVEANRRELRSTDDLLAAVSRGRKHGKVLLLVRRGEDEIYIPIRFN